MQYLAGHQPNYWPYPGLIGKIMRADRFVYVTKVQFEKKSWQKRNRLRTKEGWTYIQVPTITSGKYTQNICDVRIDNQSNWAQKHLKTIELLYRKAPYYSRYIDEIRKIYSVLWERLSDLDIHIMNYILSEMGNETPVYYDRDYEFTGHKTEMLVNMCEKLDCDSYLSNLGSQAYVQISKFEERGKNHRYIDYTGCKYPQQFVGFEPGLSILDMMMNCGSERTREILLDDGNYRFSEINKEMDG